MGMDISTWAEVRIDGKWVKNEKKIFDDGFNDISACPFAWRSSSMAAIFGNDIRFKDTFNKISELKGLPDDSEYLNTKLNSPIHHSYGGYDNGTAYTKKEDYELDINNFGHSYLTLKELLDFNYDATVTGNSETYRECLSPYFFENLELMKTLGKPDDVRVIFYFD